MILYDFGVSNFDERFLDIFGDYLNPSAWQERRPPPEPLWSQRQLLSGKFPQNIRGMASVDDLNMIITGYINRKPNDEAR